MTKYITIVIRCDNEADALALVPGDKIGVNTIVGVSPGDAIAVIDKITDIMPAAGLEAMCEIIAQNIEAFEQ